MTTKFERFQIDGVEFWAEVDQTASPASAFRGSDNRARIHGEASKLTTIDLHSILQAIVGQAYRAFTLVKPDEATVELSIGLKGEIGAFIAKSEGSASVKIVAKWTSANLCPPGADVTTDSSASPAESMERG